MVYRDHELAARLRRDELVKQRSGELAALPWGLYSLYARRVARTAAGLAGSLGAALVALGALYQIHQYQNPTRDWLGRLDGFEELPPPYLLSLILLGASALALLAYLSVKALYPRAARRALERIFSPSESPSADIERLERLRPLVVLKAQVSAWERLSLAWPLTALSLLAPLTLHYLIALPLGGGARFDGWIVLSVLLVGLPHLALVGLVWRFSSLALQRPSERLLALQWYGARALWLVSVATLLSPVLLDLLAFLVEGQFLTRQPLAIGMALLPFVLLTGLAFIPWMYRVAILRLSAERAEIETFL
jgi:hypothetical protein